MNIHTSSVTGNLVISEEAMYGILKSALKITIRMKNKYFFTVVRKPIYSTPPPNDLHYLKLHFGSFCLAHRKSKDKLAEGYLYFLG